MTPISAGDGNPDGHGYIQGRRHSAKHRDHEQCGGELFTSSLSPGTHNLTASYSGDANFSQSSSAVLAEQIVCGLLLSLSPSTVRQGGTVTVAAKLISCSTSAQTVVVKFTLAGLCNPTAAAAQKQISSRLSPFPLPAENFEEYFVPVPDPEAYVHRNIYDYRYNARKRDSGEHVDGLAEDHVSIESRKEEADRIDDIAEARLCFVIAAGRGKPSLCVSVSFACHWPARLRTSASNGSSPALSRIFR